MKQSPDIITIRKTDESIPIALTQDGIPIDLTGATLYFTVKKTMDDSATDTTALIKKDITAHYDAINGRSEIILTKTDLSVPGDYVYGIAYKLSSGEVAKVFFGKFKIVNDPTLRA